MASKSMAAVFATVSVVAAVAGPGIAQINPSPDPPAAAAPDTRTRCGTTGSASPPDDNPAAIFERDKTGLGPAPRIMTEEPGRADPMRDPAAAKRAEEKVLRC
jgi:hypothetical protein